MADQKKAAVYDESKIKTLSSLEHIRKRTGMYIGRIGDGSSYEDGIYILLKEVIDNAVDEFIMGHGRRVEVAVDGGEVSVRDFGRGIPLGKVVECVSRINTGAKYNSDVFQFSVGLNGVGTKAVNALSSSFLVRAVRKGRYAQAVFKRGELRAHVRNGAAPGEAEGTLIRFTPDERIFGPVAFDHDLVRRRVRLYTFLNAGLEIDLNGDLYVSGNGLRDLVTEEVADEALYETLHARSPMMEVALTHTSRYKETYFSFVNGQHTTDGGTHLSAFREGVLKAFNAFCDKRFEGDEVRESLVGAIAVRLQDPVFESQTKNKLGNTEIRSDLVNKVRETVEDLLHRHPEAAERAVRKIEATRKLRRELQAVKKMAREKERSVSIRVPQLKDCKNHYDRRRGRGEESMLFITEGQSAAGSITSCRDPRTQAVFTLKGKPLNVCNLRRDTLYRNDELYNLMRSLDIEEGIERLRYRYVVLATDADVDGLHIRNLLLTFFLRYFCELVLDGHVRILETPLFRVRDRRKTLYCYDETERDRAVAAMGRGAEVTRFKGLGEISPAEFKQFIGPDIRLTPVRIGDEHCVSRVLSYYMGRNTPDRRAYIMKHLVVEVTA